MMINKHDTIAEVACPLCQRFERDVVGTEEGLSAVRCRGCGLFYINPRRTKANKFDGGDPGAVLSSAKYGAIFRGEAAHPRDVNYVEHLRNIERWKRPGKLLDVGAHCGFFGRVAAGRGWEVCGVEPNPTKAGLARSVFGLNVFAGFLHETHFCEHSFDVVTMVDVFEHVHEPAALLHQVRRFLKPDGLLMIKVPNGEYTYWKWRWYRRLGTERQCWDSNEHVVHYTCHTLERMLAHTNFRVVEWIVPKPIRSGVRDALDPRAWRNPAYVFREVVKKALYRYGQLQLRARGTYFVLLPDIEVLAMPA